jgi:hypothetical protein
MQTVEAAHAFLQRKIELVTNNLKATQELARNKQDEFRGEQARTVSSGSHSFCG